MPPLARHLELRVQQADDWIGRVLGELRGVRLLEPTHVASELDDRALQSEADSEERHLVLTRPADGLKHALDTRAGRSPPGIRSPSKSLSPAIPFWWSKCSEESHSMLTFTSFAMPPWMSASWIGLVGVDKLRVLAHDSDCRFPDWGS